MYSLPLEGKGTEHRFSRKFFLDLKEQLLLFFFLCNLL